MTLSARRRLRLHARRALVALLPVLSTAVLLPALASPTPAAYAGAEPAPRAATGSLSVSPSVHVAGQAVRFRGNIGRAGVRTVHLESHMNRPGDTWLDVRGTSFRTNAQGGFDFTFPAPSMFKISYRVASGALATSAYLFSARPQELTLTLAGQDPDLPFYPVTPLAPFTVLADTTPAVRSALGTPPPIPGRTVLLQERAGHGWRTLQSGVTDQDGHARFTVTAPLLGERVLRARQERWTKGGSEIGWYASFPAYFSVRGLGELSDLFDLDAPSEPRKPGSASTSPLRPTASERFGWGASLFDFAWERGQDLTSPPSKGTRPRGAWRDTSTGTGRAIPFNGGLVLQSRLKHGGAGDLGTSTATLRRNAQARGRWEFRLQGHVWESGARPYRFLLELVPPGAPVTACSPRSIVVADVTMGSPGLAVGVRSREAGSVWRRTLGDVRLAETPFNMAVEVGRGHVTWFRDAKPVATVKDTRARLGTRLVPRFSLVGQQVEMNGAQVDSDWQRAWPLDRGKQVRSGDPLRRSRYAC